jgi:DNA-binding NtrC family response regulator
VRILVVDDDPIVLASCRRILETRGFTVVTAGSVSAAVEQTVAQGFGLIIVDLKMPERDGLQLVQKARSWGRPVPVIVMSGYPTSETVLSSLQSGAFAFLPKPFTPDELMGALQVVLPDEINP